jgi:DNA-binding winged helix-turn-helix (wHTH) protein/TolB-like protein
MQKLSHQTHSFDGFTLDLTRGCLLRGIEEVRLRPKAFEVLSYLVANNLRLVSKDEFIHAVWVDTAVTDDSLVQCLMEVRRALGDDGQQIIKTVPRRGYIFDKEVRDNGSAAQMTTYTEETAGVQVIIEEETDAREQHEIAAQTPQLPPAPKESVVRRFTGAIWRHKIVTVVALAIVAVAVVGLARPFLTWWFKPPSIAILPFVNATGDPALDSAGDGLTEGIIQSLSQINAPSKFPRLLVAPLFSVSTFKGRDIDPRNAGREMGVDFVLAGKITQNDKVLTTKVELIKVADGSLVWNRQDSKLGLLFSPGRARIRLCCGREARRSAQDS